MTSDAPTHDAGPLVDPPDEGGLNKVLAGNIDMLRRRRASDDRKLPLQDKLAGAVTRFTGRMGFVYAHLLVIVGWILVNHGLVPWLKPFDNSYVLLATTASVEAIFLSTFVLIAQNRAQVDADKRADLDLQISLLTEHELTRLGALMAEIATHLGVSAADHPEVREVTRDVSPDKVLDEIDRRGKAPA